MLTGTTKHSQLHFAITSRFDGHGEVTTKAQGQTLLQQVDLNVAPGESIVVEKKLSVFIPVAKLQQMSMPLLGNTGATVVLMKQRRTPINFYNKSGLKVMCKWPQMSPAKNYYASIFFNCMCPARRWRLAI
ncbi:hypothetical protein [Lacticaseibacillus manihotivorans]|uniref:hypothetical protein n=1 Tax=Lacticaseibacillus manihotivorans TaxID=88233 RepID=UPI000A6C5390|nr:hypothetical protein [Lacticaseibacillus manihotivorans]